MAATSPAITTNNVAKANEFYPSFLGFEVDWDHSFDDNAPLYRQVSRGDLILHLSEHHGDGSRGARLRVMMRGVEEFQREISAKAYRYMGPGLEKTPWGRLETGAIDPFGNLSAFASASTNGDAHPPTAESRPDSSFYDGAERFVVIGSPKRNNPGGGLLPCAPSELSKHKS
jgi:catechol 2,3-dioxygenase-like lactoylglutathione lyase family enzyme